MGGGKEGINLVGRYGEIQKEFGGKSKYENHTCMKFSKLREYISKTVYNPRG